MIQMIISCMADYGIFLWFNRMYDYGKYKIIKVTSLYFWMVLVVYLSNTMGILSPAGRTIMTVCYYFAAMFVLYTGMKPLQKMIRSIILLAVMILSEMFAMAVVLISIDEVSYYTVMDSTLYWLFILSSTKIIQIIFLNIMNKIYFAKIKEISWKEMVWHLIFLGITFAYLYMMVKAMYLNLTGQQVFVMAFGINAIFILVVFVGYYIFWKNYDEKNQQKELIRLMKEKQEMQMKEYWEAISFKEEYQKKEKMETGYIEKTEDGYTFLDFADICYVETEGRKICIHTVNGKYIAGKTMKEQEKILDKGTFFRCHASYIVNVMHIRSVDGVDIIMKDGDKIILSKHKKKEFMDWFLKYQ